MGTAHARLLVAEGAKVVIADLLDESGAALAAELGNSARYTHLDVTDAEQWDAAVALAVRDFGQLNVLVNNAGIVLDNSPERLIQNWRRVLEVNLTGAFLGAQSSLEALKSAGGGSIVNISSIAGLRGEPMSHAYTASKWAVRGLTKSLALELAAHNIRVNSVHPGEISTVIAADLVTDENSLDIPLGRPGAPGEVSPIIVFLASDESSYCTGSEFIVDGGLTAGLPRNLHKP